MKKVIELQILRADILSTNYFDCSDCPITRAYKRAGYEDFQDTGTSVVNNKGWGHEYSREEMQSGKRVAQMYTKGGEPADFEFTVTLNLPE